MNYWNKYDQWLNSILWNGMNHFVHSAKVILGFYFTLGWMYSLFAYIGSIIFFYGLEVKQAMDTQSVPFKLALKWWEWQKSKKQDVFWVIVLGGALVLLLRFF